MQDSDRYSNTASWLPIIANISVMELAKSIIKKNGMAKSLQYGADALVCTSIILPTAYKSKFDTIVTSCM